MTISNTYTARLSFPKHTNIPVDVSAKPWDENYIHGNVLHLQINIEGEQNVTVHAVDLEEAQAKVEQAVVNLKATLIGDVKLLTYSES